MTWSSAPAVNLAGGAATSQAAVVASRILMNLTTAVTGGTITGTWIVGNNQPKLDAGVVAAATSYHVWLIERTDTGVIDFLYSTSASAPVLPTNYSKSRRIGSVFTDGSANILKFFQYGDDFMYDICALDFNITNPGATAALATLSIPNGINAKAYLNVVTVAGTNSFGVLFSAPDVTDSAPSATAAPLENASPFNQAAAANPAGNVAVWSNTARQVRVRLTASGVADILRIATCGYLDRRGRG